MFGIQSTEEYCVIQHKFLTCTHKKQNDKYVQHMLLLLRSSEQSRWIGVDATIRIIQPGL